MPSQAVLLGIDLGTSGVKAVLLSESGDTLALASRECPIETPKPGFAEQHPDSWWQATVEVIREALDRAAINPSRIAGISFSGQMHGTVVLGRDLRPLRPAIIWADQRSAPQVSRIRAQLGIPRMLELTANVLNPGFMGATLAWLAEEEPDTLRLARLVILPKDYLRLRLTGQVASDVSDASSTAVFDTARRCWSEEMLTAVGAPLALMPEVLESTALAGGLTPEAAQATGLVPDTPVVAGGGDQPVAALGNGVIEPGLLLLTVGTGGQVFAPLDSPAFDPQARVHTFCHCLPGRWHLLGATLCAGLSLRWLRDLLRAARPQLDYFQLEQLAAQAPPGCEGLLFCPYLIGERTPHLDPDLRGAFLGLSLHHGLPHLVRAVLEGVAFSLRDALEVLREMGVNAQSAIVSGGGGRSPLWRQILADVLALELTVLEGEEQAALGAAMLAGIGAGVFADASDACRRVVKPAGVITPSANTDLYQRQYPRFRACHPALKYAQQ